MAQVTCLFRPMSEADIPQVYAIDHESFPAESLFRPYSSYSREMHNSMAHYVVACVPSAGRTRELRESWLKRALLRNPLRPSPLCTGEELLVGFAGFWMMLDEAHIIAIAVREPYRGQGIGQGLLLSIIDMAVKLQARLITLEVRDRNLGAQAMYRKHGFEVVGRRPHYYSDNQEDAVLMTIEDLRSADFRERFKQLKADTLKNNCLARPMELADLA